MTVSPKCYKFEIFQKDTIKNDFNGLTSNTFTLFLKVSATISQHLHQSSFHSPAKPSFFLSAKRFIKIHHNQFILNLAGLRHEMITNFSPGDCPETLQSPRNRAIF